MGAYRLDVHRPNGPCAPQSITGCPRPHIQWAEPTGTGPKNVPKLTFHHGQTIFGLPSPKTRPLLRAAVLDRDPAHELDSAGVGVSLPLVGIGGSGSWISNPQGFSR
jgi:hypothetical protein